MAERAMAEKQSQSEKKSAANEALAGLSFEKALAELEDIVKKLEEGRVELEESIALYERGAALKAHCDAKLRQAEERIQKIVVDADGKPRAQNASFE
jgi:exodeoxyribonuclease VII small subunit